MYFIICVVDVSLSKREYEGLPLGALTDETREKMAELLDLEGNIITFEFEVGRQLEVINNYLGLAELAGFTFCQIRAMEVNVNVYMLIKITSLQIFNI